MASRRAADLAATTGQDPKHKSTSIDSGNGLQIDFSFTAFAKDAGMATEGVQRRLAAILAADVVGYSRLIEQDEAGTIAALRQVWSETFGAAVAARRGRV